MFFCRKSVNFRHNIDCRVIKDMQVICLLGAILPREVFLLLMEYFYRVKRLSMVIINIKCFQ